MNILDPIITGIEQKRVKLQAREVAVKFYKASGTADLKKGQVMRFYFAGGAIDTVQEMTAGGQGVFAGVLVKDYDACKSGDIIKMYVGSGECDALCDGTTDIAIGDLLYGDDDLGGFVKITGDAAWSPAAIALEAYTSNAAALKKVYLTGAQFSEIDT